MLVLQYVLEATSSWWKTCLMEMNSGEPSLLPIWRTADHFFCLFKWLPVSRPRAIVQVPVSSFSCLYNLKHTDKKQGTLDNVRTLLEFRRKISCVLSRDTIRKKKQTKMCGAPKISLLMRWSLSVTSRWVVKAYLWMSMLASLPVEIGESAISLWRLQSSSQISQPEWVWGDFALVFGGASKWKVVNSP